MKRKRKKSSYRKQQRALVKIAQGQIQPHQKVQQGQNQGQSPDQNQDRGQEVGPGSLVRGREVVPVSLARGLEVVPGDRGQSQVHGLDPGVVQGEVVQDVVGQLLLSKGDRGQNRDQDQEVVRRQDQGVHVRVQDLAQEDRGDQNQDQDRDQEVLQVNQVDRVDQEVLPQVQIKIILKVAKFQKLPET